MKYMVQVKGDWAGLIGGWRPACSGSENQTNESDAEASTFDSPDAAFAYMDYLRTEYEPKNADFRVVEVES